MEDEFHRALRLKCCFAAKDYLRYAPIVARQSPAASAQAPEYKFNVTRRDISMLRQPLSQSKALSLNAQFIFPAVLSPPADFAARHTLREEL